MQVLTDLAFSWTMDVKEGPAVILVHAPKKLIWNISFV